MVCRSSKGHKQSRKKYGRKESQQTKWVSIEKIVVVSELSMLATGGRSSSPMYTWLFALHGGRYRSSSFHHLGKHKEPTFPNTLALCIECTMHAYTEERMKVLRVITVSV